MIIHYQVGEHTGSITWAANEYSDELNGQTYSLNQMEATLIATLAQT